MVLHMHTWKTVMGQAGKKVLDIHIGQILKTHERLEQANYCPHVVCLLRFESP